MNKRVYLVICVIVFIFLGCSTKEDNLHTRDGEKEQAIISTQKARLTLEDNSTLLIMATYLNNLEKYSKNMQDTIALSVYFSRANDNNQTLGFPKVTINNIEASVIELKKDDEVISYLPTTNEWSRYYLIVGIKDVDFKEINVTIDIYPFSRAQIVLQRDF